MNTQEQNLIEELFARLRQAEEHSGPRDAQAEALVLRLTEQQPAAAYYMAQAVLVQEQALKAQQERIEQLERELAERPQSGGFLGGLFGGARPASPPRNLPAAPFGGGDRAGQQPGQTGGFLGGAVQTAMGVAGGVLLGNAVAGLFAEPAQAAEPPVVEPEQPSDEDSLFGFEGEDEF